LRIKRKTKNAKPDFTPGTRAGENQGEKPGTHRPSWESIHVLFEALTDAVILLKNGIIIDCNTIAPALFHCTKEQLIGTSLFSRSPKKQPDGNPSGKQAEKLAGTAQHGAKHTFNWRINASGELVDTQISLAGCLWRGEEYTVAIIKYFSTQINVEQALAESEKKYRALVDNASETIIVAQDGLIKFANNKAFQLLGYKNDELLGRPFLQFIHTDDRNMVLRRYQARMEMQSVPDRYDFRLVHKDGRIKWVQIHAALFDWEQRPATLNLLTDISSQRIAEQEQRKSEKLMQIVAENYPRSFIAIIDQNLKLIFLSGHEMQEHPDALTYTGKNVLEVFSEDGPEVVTRIKQVAESTFAGRQVLTEIKTNNYYLRLNTVPLRNEQGKIDRILAVLENITEQKETEAKYREVEDKFRLTFDNASDAIYLLELTDDGPIIREVNTAALQSHGYIREEVIGKSSAMLIDKERKPQQANILGKIKKGENVRYYAVDRRKDGSTFPVEISARLVKINNQPFVLSIERDVTEQKAVEQQLLEQRDLLSATLESTADGILVVTGDKHIVRTNSKFFRMWGIPAKLAQSKDRYMLIEAIQNQLEDPVAFRARLEDLSKSPKEALDLVYCNDGRVFELYSSPIQLGEKKTGRVFSFRDITKKVQSEARIQDLNKQLQLQIERMPIGLIVFGADSRIQSWNPAAEKIFGFTAQEAIGAHPYDIIVPENQQQDTDKIWQRLLNADESAHSINENITKKGKTITCQWTNTPLIDEDGAIHGVLSMAIDITEKKHTEEQLTKYQMHLESLVRERTQELEQQTEKMRAAQKAMRYLVEDANEARAQLEEANALLRESISQLESFAYSVSHDLRAPLRAISGFSNKLLRLYSDQIDAEGKRLLNVINDNTIKMGQLIEDLLAFSRIGRTVVNITQVDMTAMAREIANELHMAHPLYKIEFSISPLRRANGDPRLLHQALYNLMENAVKYSSRKEVQKIEVRMSRKDGSMVYCVKDNGVGFDMQYADKLFKVFHRLHSEKEFKGTGVGLAIAELIIHRHNGRIWAEAKPNAGAAFYFTLPPAKKNKRDSNVRQ